MPPLSPPEPQNTGPRPNPLRDATPYGMPEIGGVLVPGALQSVTGIEAEQEWNFQKAGGGGAAANSANPDPANAPATGAAATTTTGTSSAGSFGVSVWRGAKLAESITITAWITTIEDYDAWLDLIKVLMPARGKKVPSHQFTYPPANEVGINRVAVKKIGVPVEDKPGSGKYIGTIELCEYNPQKTAAAGKADPAKPGDAPKPQDAADKQLQELLDKAKA